VRVCPLVLFDVTDSMSFAPWSAFQMPFGLFDKNGIVCYIILYGYNDISLRSVCSEVGKP